jgi:hypothetical protein
MDLMGNNRKPKSLKFVLIRQPSETEYGVWRCSGPIGCGESITTDHRAEHAATQHYVYEFDEDSTAVPGRG